MVTLPLPVAAGGSIPRGTDDSLGLTLSLTATVGGWSNRCERPGPSEQDSGRLGEMQSQAKGLTDSSNLSVEGHAQAIVVLSPPRGEGGIKRGDKKRQPAVSKGLTLPPLRTPPRSEGKG